MKTYAILISLGVCLLAGCPKKQTLEDDMQEAKQRQVLETIERDIEDLDEDSGIPEADDAQDVGPTLEDDMLRPPMGDFYQPQYEVRPNDALVGC